MAREYIVYSAHINKKKRPEAGTEGGEVVVAGTPEEVMACERSYTGHYLKLHNATK